MVQGIGDNIRAGCITLMVIVLIVGILIGVGCGFVVQKCSQYSIKIEKKIEK